MLEMKSVTGRQTAALVGLLLAALVANGCGGPEAKAEGPTVEERLAVLEADLAAREQALTARSEAVAERERTLAAESEDLAKRQEQLAESERKVEGRIDGVAERAAGVNQRAEELRRREAALAENESRTAAERQALAEAQAEAEREAARAAEVARQNPPEVYAEIALAAQTRLEVEFLSTVSSASSRPGDRFVTRVTRDLSADDGRLVIPAGTELAGVVTEAESLKRVGGQARLGLAFGELRLPWGKNAEIQASFYDAGRNESRRDRRIIGGAAAGGAVLGAILDDDKGRGTILGAILGAAAGTAAAANKARDEVEIPGGTVVTLQLDQPAQIQVPWRSRYTEAEVARAGER
jgi:hypothetical protein